MLRTRILDVLRNSGAQATTWGHSLFSLGLRGAKNFVASATIALIDQYLAVNGSVNGQSVYVQDNSVYVQDNVAVLLSRTAIKQNP